MQFIIVWSELAECELDLWDCSDSNNKKKRTEKIAKYETERIIPCQIPFTWALKVILIEKEEQEMMMKVNKWTPIFLSIKERIANPLVVSTSRFSCDPHAIC